MIKLRWIFPTLITVFGLGCKAAKAPLTETEPLFILAIILFVIGAIMTTYDDYTTRTKVDNVQTN